MASGRKTRRSDGRVEDADGASVEDHFGLYRHDLMPKPAARRLADLARRFAVPSRQAPVPAAGRPAL